MKKIKNFLLLIFFLYITLQVLLNNSLINNTIIDAIEIWKNKLFPNLFPFFVLSDFLVNYGFSYYISIIISKPFKLLFKTTSIGAYIFILSIISGFPSSSKFIKDLIDNNLITDNDGTKLLLFTHFSNPLFILGFLNNFIEKKYCILILIVHYLTNIIIGLLFRNYNVNENNSNLSFNPDSFGNILKKSITNSINTLLLILGTITFFMIINTIINSLNINIYFKYLINCFLEMTNGINYIGLSNLDINIKVTLFTMILSFGGICVHFQVISIISNTKIKYQPYLIARLLHSAISGILVFIICNLIY